MKKNDNLVPGFLFGLAAGAVLGILLAPQKGSELRADLKEDLSKWKDNFLCETGNVQATASAEGDGEPVEEKSPGVVTE